MTSHILMDDSTTPSLLDSEFSRVIGKRRPPREGELRAPSSQDLERVRQLNSFAARVPKGVFRYRTHEEANADWTVWTAATMAANETQNG